MPPLAAPTPPFPASSPAPSRVHRRRRRAGALILAATAAVAAASCSKTETVTVPPSSTAAPAASAPGSSGPSGPAPTTAPRAATPTTTGTSGTVGSAADAADGPCSYLTTEEVAAAVDTTPDDATVVRGGCRWEIGTTPLLDLEIEKPADPAASFAADKALYGGDEVSGIGEDAYLEGLTQKVVFLSGDAIYTVWVQADIEDVLKVDASIGLARRVAGRV